MPHGVTLSVHLFSGELGSLGLDKITDAYATCADRFEGAYLNEMGSLGWEMVSLSALEETVPGGQWCRTGSRSRGSGK